MVEFDAWPAPAGLACSTRRPRPPASRVPRSKPATRPPRRSGAAVRRTQADARLGQGSRAWGSGRSSATAWRSAASSAPAGSGRPARARGSAGSPPRTRRGSRGADRAAGAAGAAARRRPASGPRPSSRPARRGKRPLAGEGLVEHDAQAVDVGAAVDRLRTTFGEGLEVLGRHVVDRAAQGRLAARPFRPRARARGPG